MRKFTTCLAFGSTLLLLSACTITENVDPVESLDGREVCVINNPDVREGFEQTLLKSIQERGYDPRTLAASANLSDCPTAVTYVGRWSWDLTIYMSYAHVQVFREGKLAGDALYDSTSGGGNMAKFINAEPKIREMVFQLFPAS